MQNERSIHGRQSFFIDFLNPPDNFQIFIKYYEKGRCANGKLIYDQSLNLFCVTHSYISIHALCIYIFLVLHRLNFFLLPSLHLLHSLHVVKWGGLLIRQRICFALTLTLKQSNTPHTLCGNKNKMLQKTKVKMNAIEWASQRISYIAHKTAKPTYILVWSYFISEGTSVQLPP